MGLFWPNSSGEPIVRVRWSALRCGAFAHRPDPGTRYRRLIAAIRSGCLGVARCAVSQGSRYRRRRSKGGWRGFRRLGGCRGNRFARRQRGPRTGVPNHALGLNDPGISFMFTAESRHGTFAAVRHVHLDIEAVFSPRDHAIRDVCHPPTMAHFVLYDSTNLRAGSMARPARPRIVASPRVILAAAPCAAALPPGGRIPCAAVPDCPAASPLAARPK